MLEENMKKHLLILIAIMVIICVAMLAGCDMFKGSQDPNDDEKITFTVTFDTQGGSQIDPITVGEGEALTLPQTPTKEGYIFDGWYLDDSFVEQFNATQTISANITVYAKWRLPNTNEVYISFDTDGGSEINGYYAITGTTINLPSAPTKQGFDFEAWKYGDETYAAGAEFFVLDEDVQFVALWLSQNLRYVTYETNGGSEIEQSIVEDGSKLTAPKQPKRPGYLFGGWYKDKDCTVLWDFDKDSVTESITLYAKWNIDVVGISSVEGASIDGTNIFMAVDKDVEFVELAEKVILSSNAYWNLYYDRLGQTKIPTKIAANKDSGTLNKKENTFYILVTSEDGLQEKLYTLTIYRRITIDVQYYDVYGNELYKTEMDNYNTIETPYDYNPKGYSLKGWKYNFTANGTKNFVFGNNGTVVTNENALNLYPITTANKYFVNLQVNDGETVSDSSMFVTYDSSKTFPVPTKTGYSFAGWYNGSTKVTSNTGFCSRWTYAQDVTLTPKWEINSYNVTLSSNISGGTLNGNGLHEYNSKVTISATTNVGYVWIGWFEGETKLTDDVQYVFTIKDADRRFTAKWSTITLEKNISAAGVVMVENACKVGENVTIKATTNKGYTFIGWFEGEGKLSDEQEYTFKATEQSRTFTAKWSKITLEKNVSAAGSVAVENACKVGENVTIKAMTNKGYTFIGWFEGEKKLSDEQEYTFKATEQNRTLTAKWSTITLEKNISVAGSVQAKIANEVGGDTTISATTNIGYIFIGWFEGEEKLSDKQEHTFKATEQNRTITAKWEVVAEMQNFVFTSTATTCTITSIKDKTISSIIVPDYVTSIGESAFRGCSGLTSITLPFVGASKTASGCAQVFGYIFGYTTTSSSDSVSGATCQYYCYPSYNGRPNYYGDLIYYHYYIPSSIKSVTITGGNITNVAFKNCARLASITILDSVTNIGNSAFSGCTGLTKITGSSDAVSTIVKQCESKAIEEIIITSGTSISSQAFYECSNLTSITISDSVTSIGDKAFYNCSKLTGIVIPNSVTSIGKYAFYGCSGLTSMTLPFVGASATANNGYDQVFGYIFGYETSGRASSTSGATYQYDGGTAYYHYYIPSSIKSVTVTGENIPSRAFKNCSSLTSITISDSVTSIGKYAFNNTAWYNNQPDGLVYVGKVAYKYKGTMPSNTSIIIKDGTISITGSAFRGCSGLTSITIPDSVTSIGEDAFYGCSGLTSITIPDSVTSIGDGAFNGCTGLTSVTIGNSVTSIGARAFESCSGLTSITIPDSVTSIGDYAFYRCSNLTSINFNGTQVQWKAISKGIDWKGKIPSSCKVVCTDGTVSI